MKDCKVVTVTPKSTTANTQYWEFSDHQDELDLYKWLYIFLCDMCEECTFNTEVKAELFSRSTIFPKGRRGPNSMMSILGGLLQQKTRNPARNLTSKQLGVIEDMFGIISKHYATEVNPPQRIVFDKDLY